MMLVRYTAETGEILDILPKAFRPLSFGDLESGEGTQDKTYPMKIEANSIEGLPNGKQPSGPGLVSIPITFRQPVSIFGLVEGGWLPIPFVQPAKLLVDRNVVASLAQLRRGASRPDLGHTDWWFEFFKEFSVEINPALYAFEGNNRRPPTLEEFCRAFEEASNEIAKQLPGATLTRYDRPHYQAAYALITEFANRLQRETQFLIRIAPKLTERVADPQLPKFQSEILELGHQLELRTTSLVVLAALACLYERRDGSGILAARKIIKPKRAYSPDDAYNALSDLRALEMFLSGLGLDREPFAFCTCDKAIAAFWCGLAAHSGQWIDERFSFTVSLSDDLFPRLQESGRMELIARLTEGR